jgi:hypothetical protein
VLKVQQELKVQLELRELKAQLGQLELKAFKVDKV